MDLNVGVVEVDLGRVFVEGGANDARSFLAPQEDVVTGPDPAHPQCEALPAYFFFIQSKRVGDEVVNGSPSPPFHERNRLNSEAVRELLEIALALRFDVDPVMVALDCRHNAVRLGGVLQVLHQAFVEAASRRGALERDFAPKTQQCKPRVSFRCGIRALGRGVLCFVGHGSARGFWARGTLPKPLQPTQSEVAI